MRTADKNSVKINPIRLAAIAVIVSSATIAGLVVAVYRAQTQIERHLKTDFPSLLTIAAALKNQEHLHSSFEFLVAEEAERSDLVTKQVESLTTDFDRLSGILEDFKRLHVHDGNEITKRFADLESSFREFLRLQKESSLTEARSYLEAVTLNKSLAFAEAMQVEAEEVSHQRESSLEENNRFVREMLASSAIAMTLVILLWYLVVLAFKRSREEQKLIEKQLETERAASVQSLKLTSLGEMAGGIAHEINNPLAIIAGSVNQMQSVLSKTSKGAVVTTEFQENLDKYLTRIEKTVERIGKIIHSLRVFARDGSHDEHAFVDVKSIVEDVRAFSEERIKFRGIMWKSAQNWPDLSINCNIVQIQQILVNLLNNSIDAIAGGSDPWVEFSTVMTSDYFAIRVQDSGPGIPPAVAEKMMQPFFTTKEVGKGTGVGLSVSVGIMQSHGGELVYLQSEPNTTFELRFKLDRLRANTTSGRKLSA